MTGLGDCSEAGEGVLPGAPSPKLGLILVWCCRKKKAKLQKKALDNRAGLQLYEAGNPRESSLEIARWMLTNCQVQDESQTLCASIHCIR